MTSLSGIEPSRLVGLLLALGIGLKRERRKGDGPDRRPAGIRSFALVAVGGALTELLSEPGLVAVGGLLVASLAAVSHFKSRSLDPGLTTELALFVTYLVGVLVASQPVLGTACGVALALLLNTRTRLHRFATDVLTEQELHDGLLLCAAALIVLPLVPDRSVAWLGEINPRPLAAIAVLILALQAVSHVAVRWLGPRVGLMAAGCIEHCSDRVARQAGARRARACGVAGHWRRLVDRGDLGVGDADGRRPVDRGRVRTRTDRHRRAGVHAGGLCRLAGPGVRRRQEWRGIAAGT